MPEQHQHLQLLFENWTTWMTWSMLYLYLVIRTLHLFGNTHTTSIWVNYSDVTWHDAKRWFYRRVFQKLATFVVFSWFVRLAVASAVVSGLGCSSWAGCTELRQDVQAQLAKAKDRLAKVHMHEIAFNQYQTLLVLNMLSNQDNMFVHSTHTGHCIHTLFLIYDGLWPVSWNRYNMHWPKRRALLRGKWTVGWRPVFGCSILWYMSCAS